MFCVYVLKSEKDEKLYVGATSDLRWRLLEHNSEGIESTKARRPFQLRYCAAYHSEADARVREAQLKKDGKALGQLKRRIAKSLL